MLSAAKDLMPIANGDEILAVHQRGGSPGAMTERSPFVILLDTILALVSLPLVHALLPT
jgi:hypothetical protein